MAINSMREAVGPYYVMTEEYWFAAADSAGTMGDVGSAASTVLTFEAPAAGWVAGYVLDAIGGNLTDADYLVNVAGSPVAASAFTVTGAAAASGTYKAATITFAAGDAVQLELDDITTGRITRVKLILVLASG